MKRVICLVGLPGSGKSTVAEFLKVRCGARSLHLPEVVGHLVPEAEREEARYRAQLLTGPVESAFLDEIDRSSETVVVLDGFLRSIPRLRRLREAAETRCWSLEILCLFLPGLPGTLCSVFRQVRRDLSGGKELSRIYRKLRRDLPSLPRILDAADGIGIPIYSVAGHPSKTAVQEQVRTRLGFSLQQLPWDLVTLQKVASAAPDAWVTGGGHLYRPFFDNRYGPPTKSWDVDLRVWGEDRAAEVQDTLSRREPCVRWHIKDALSWSLKELNHRVQSVEDSLSRNALVCTSAGVRWSGEGVELLCGHPDAEADLWRGLLRRNADGQTAFAEAKARKIINYYPGTTAPFLGYKPAQIVLTYSQAMAASRLAEKASVRRAEEVSPIERGIALQTCELRRSLNPAAQPVCWPDPAPFPDGNPWFSQDGSFRVWVVNQTRSRNPRGGRDEYLQNALRSQRAGVQKPTHQGWTLELHALHSLLELETDHIPRFRTPLRLAMLWHDLGKLWNPYTPGTHGAIGAKKWLAFQGRAPDWLAADAPPLISHLILCHDVFGRLEQGLWDPSYSGALTPTSARRTLESPLVPGPVMAELAKSMWLADVGSVPLLRWLRPLGDLLHQLVISGFREPADSQTLKPG